jgi:large subunit ribosomal protein L31
MKKDIHPDYKEVVFQDVQSDFKFLTRSTMSSDEKIKWEDGKEYPLIKVEVSSASHPFYTGKKIFVDTAGRVEKFNQKYKAKQAVKPATPETKPVVEEKPVENTQETEKVKTPEAVAETDEVTQEAPAAEETTQEAPAAEETTEEAPAAEETTEEAPAAEETTEEAPAAEETTEEAPAAEETTEEGDDSKEN